METKKIEGIKRESLGKKSNRDLRKADNIPCVIYGGKEVHHFSTSQKEVKDIIYTPNFYQINVSIDGKETPCILKEIQFHPVTDKILHIDFQELVPGKKIRTSLPIRFEGQAAGTKEGGSLIPKLRRLNVKGEPKALVDSISIDVSPLELGKSLKVADLDVEGLEILDSLSLPICSVEVPRALKSAQAAADELAEGEEGAEGAEAAEGAEGGDGAAKEEGSDS